ncbi:MAG TPA: hypothetical protein VE046_03790 [Steroidobacteraceae bacterium]|nr:hypothetical protein [Steroidobacteraceae bacterium]
MSLWLCVHFDRRRLITLQGWRGATSKLEYPLVFPDSLDPAETPGYFDCSYAGEATSFAIDLNEEPELPSPFPNDVDRLTMEFTVNTLGGEIAWFAAVAAAAAFCLATDGVVEDGSCSRFASREVGSWANSILNADDSMTEVALKHPHPDSVPVTDIKGPSEPWRKRWRRT